MSEELVIFQLGDMHFPEFGASTTDVDSHDSSQPGDISNVLELPLAHRVREALIEAISQTSNFVIAVCGDLTTKGDRAGFESALDFLAAIVEDPRLEGRVTPDRLHVVPGNHDVAFRGDQPFLSFDDIERFEVLRQATRTKLGDVLATSFRKSTLTTGRASAVVMSINSCRGVGATRRFLHGVMGDELLDSVLDHDDAPRVEDVVAGIEAREGNLQEVLDVPLFHPSEVGSIAVTLGQVGLTPLAIVVAHHSLLPQHTPRLNPYTEMANGGQARRELQKLNRAVLYLHGHLHRDVVENVTAPLGPSMWSPPIVMIGAPTLSEGFNRIAVRYDSSGNALGAKVYKHRIRAGEQTVSLDPQITNIALANRQASSEAERKLILRIAETAIAKGGELVAWAASETTIHLSDAEIETFVESLYWQGVLRQVDPIDYPFAQTGFML